MTFKEIINNANDLSIDELKKLVSNVLSNINYGSIIAQIKHLMGYIEQDSIIK